MITQEQLEEFAAHWEEYLCVYLAGKADGEIVGQPRDGMKCPLAQAGQLRFGARFVVTSVEIIANGEHRLLPQSARLFVNAVDECSAWKPPTRAQVLDILADVLAVPADDYLEVSNG